jgi:hypothetical protein
MCERYSIFVGKSEKGRTLEISGCRWDGNINTDRDPG